MLDGLRKNTACGGELLDNIWKNMSHKAIRGNCEVMHNS